MDTWAFTKRELELEKAANTQARNAVENSRDVDTYHESVQGGSADLDIKGLQLDAQLQKISSNAIVDKLGWKPSKIKSHVTESMLKDYQYEMSKGILGPDGKHYKYSPASIDLTLEDPVLVAELDPVQDADLRRARVRLAAEIERLDNVLTTGIPTILENERAQYDAKVAQNSQKLVVEQIKTGRVDPALQYERRVIDDDFDRFRAVIGNRAAYVRRQIDDREAELEAYSRALADDERVKSENQAEIGKVKKENAQRLAMYEENLKLMNQGQMNIAQATGESDEDYLERMKQVGKTSYDTDQLEMAAKMYNRDKLRMLLKDLSRQDGWINTLTLLLVPEDDDPDVDPTLIVKNWGKVKKQWAETIGLYNDNITPFDAKDLIDQIVLKPDALDALVQEFREDKARQRPAAEPPRVEAINAFFAGLRAPATPVREGEVAEARVIPPWVGTPRSSGANATLVMRANRRAIDDWVQRSPIDDSLKQRFLAEKTRGDLLKTLWEHGLIDDETPIAGTPITLPARSVAAMMRHVAGPAGAGEEKTGSGIHHNFEKSVRFGRVSINPKKLHYDNTLVITDHKGQHLTGLRNTKVSDGFVDLVNKVMQGGQPSVKDFSNLRLNEKGIFDTLIHTAGLHKQVDNTFNTTKEDLKKRLELVEGEIEAGNTNPQLKQEARSILRHMAHSGLIGFGVAQNHFKQLFS